jgi:diguanylate cyclase (GGDEF)-like protein/putative nucleotidyltransferase with HDIG domain
MFNNEEYFPLTLAMIDVNGLKLTNDAFGHKMGDLLLESIANILKKECRQEDIISRIGGDEFVILLPKTDEQGAKKIIRRINNAVENEKIDNIVLSISVGFAVKEDESENINEIFSKAEDNMYRHKLSESTSMRSKTIDLIMHSLYEKSTRELLHSKRVSEICEAIAIKMNYEKSDINNLRVAGLMHDIGKIVIDEKIINKPEQLDNSEWDEIKKHPEVSYRILSSVNEFSKIADCVLEHHERWDGKGYPKGIKGEEILIDARIITIADAFASMTTNRPYTNALSTEEALEEIRRCAGLQFDPCISKIFVEQVCGKAW